MAMKRFWSSHDVCTRRFLTQNREWKEICDYGLDHSTENKLLLCFLTMATKQWLFSEAIVSQIFMPSWQKLTEARFASRVLRRIRDNPWRADFLAVQTAETYVTTPVVLDDFFSACVISNNCKNFRFSQLCFLLKIVLSSGKFPGDAHGKKSVSFSVVVLFIIRLLRLSSFEVRSHWRCKLHLL